MIRKYIVMILVVISSLNKTNGQDKVTLQSISSVGLLNGSKSSAISLQTILGAGFRHTFLGVGVGLDYYRFRTIPLFVDLRHEFGTRKRSVFLYGDLGHNYDWLTQKNIEEVNFTYMLNNFGGGLYYDAGVGYKFGFKNSDALIFSAGYTYKKIKNEVGSGMCPINGICYDYVQTYRFYLSRLVLKMGWRF